MVKLQFTSANNIPRKSNIIQIPAVHLANADKSTSNEIETTQSNLDLNTILDPLQNFVNNVYSNQQMLIDKVDKLENKLDNINKIKVLIFSDEENTETDVINFIDAISKFNEFYVEHVYINQDTIVNEFMKGYNNGVQAFIFDTYSSRLGVLNDYLNQNTDLILSNRMLISTSSTAPEFRVVKNGELTIIPRNKNILRMITNDKLQINSFIKLAKKSDYMTKHNFVIYENDAYGIPFYNSFKSLNELNEGSSFSFYTTEQMDKMITDIVSKNDKPVHIYSILFSNNAAKLLDSLALFNNDETCCSVKHVEKITNAEDYDFRKLNEEQYKAAVKHNFSFYVYNGINVDIISRLEKVADADINWTLNGLLSFDCALLASKVFNSTSKEMDATKRALKESKTLYGLTGLLQIDNDTCDRYSAVSDIEFLSILNCGFNALENPYISLFKIKNGTDISIPEINEKLHEFDFDNKEYVFISNNGVIMITKELVENFNKENGFTTNPSYILSPILGSMGIGRFGSVTKNNNNLLVKTSLLQEAKQSEPDETAGDTTAADVSVSITITTSEPVIPDYFYLAKSHGNLKAQANAAPTAR